MARVFELTHVERFDFVKMDVERAETEILDMCTDDQLRRMGALSIEWHHPVAKAQALTERLTDIGFEAHVQVGPVKARYVKARLR
jgi:hypothetical protein